MRVDDWVKRLTQTVEAREGVPFAFGRADCALFAADCVDAVTGSNWREQLQAEYSDERSALRLIASAGSLEAAVTARLGEPMAAPLFAQRGDVCLLNEPATGLGVCLGEVIACVGEEGLELHPLTSAVRAWRVG